MPDPLSEAVALGSEPVIASHHRSRRVLEPVDRIAELLFGLIMVLTFTSTISIADAGRPQVRAMLIGAIGCNLAWGLIDGIMYLMACLSERAGNVQTILAVQRAPTPGKANEAIAATLPPVVASALEEADFDKVRVAVNGIRLASERPRLALEDWSGALGVFLLVFVSTLPVVLPFLIIQDSPMALRVSNAIALLMMFISGYAFGRLSGYPPVRVACGTVALGVALVALTVSLGG